MNSVGNEPLLCFPNLLLSMLADCLFNSKLALACLFPAQNPLPVWYNYTLYSNTMLYKYHW